MKIVNKYKLRIFALIVLVSFGIYFYFNILPPIPFKIEDKQMQSSYLNNVQSLGPYYRINLSIGDKFKGIKSTFNLSIFTDSDSKNFVALTLQDHILIGDKKYIPEDQNCKFNGSIDWNFGQCGEYYHYVFHKNGAKITFLTNTSKEELKNLVKDYIN